MGYYENSAAIVLQSISSKMFVLHLHFIARWRVDNLLERSWTICEELSIELIRLGATDI